MQKRVTRRHVLAILSCALMAFVGILTETSLNVTFPTLMKQFHVGLATVQWTTTGYLLMIAVIMIPSSFLNARFSARQLFIFSYLRLASLCPGTKLLGTTSRTLVV